jgi:hypothetical protein
MYAQTAFLNCAPLSHLSWNPSGHFLFGALESDGGILFSTKTSQRERVPYFRMGPWSAQGEHVVVQDQDGCWIMAWPERKRLTSLPKHPWQWLDRTTLVAAQGTQLWTHNLAQPLLSQENTDARWKRLVALDSQKAIGLRWRPSLKETELTIWQGDRHPLLSPRFPDLSEKKPGPWAWNASKTAWACAGGSDGRDLRAWSFPQGWLLLEHETQHRVLCLELSEEALFWVDQEGFHVYHLESHALGFHPIPTNRWPGTLAWHPKNHQIAVAGRDGLRLFQPCT